jgi:hypothetical protein
MATLRLTKLIKKIQKESTLKFEKMTLCQWLETSENRGNE